MAALSNKTLIRIKRSKLNTTIALTTSIVMGVLNFAERTVFNRFFIEEYLGLFSFYNNITGILATVELGITTSIAFALYAPLEYNQRGQIAAIMSFFKNKRYFSKSFRNFRKFLRKHFCRRTQKIILKYYSQINWKDFYNLSPHSFVENIYIRMDVLCIELQKYSSTFSVQKKLKILKREMRWLEKKEGVDLP